ncbi:hypothetical protein KVA01_13490 [Kocuria varians]|uniref:Aminotransferase class I/classII domain-containing protein n=1 Tax=Kocuria varians TaxID=1272 RepID=A0A4Y4D665_KOCVA|nr:hypothetical protein KVA01_13490 [Kocuria varians]
MTTADQMPSLRRRTSTQWRSYADDVLPMFIAEMDFPTPPGVKTALEAAVANNDTGYAATGDRGAARAWAQFAASRWGWSPDPERIVYTTDVTVVIVESLRRLIRPGDGVVLTPPVYAPFYALVAEAGGHPVEVPLQDDGVTLPSGPRGDRRRPGRRGARGPTLQPAQPAGTRAFPRGPGRARADRGAARRARGERRDPRAPDAPRRGVHPRTSRSRTRRGTTAWRRRPGARRSTWRG